MLDQVRKFGLFLTLSHQRFGHLDDNLIDAALTNCKIKAIFGGLPYESAERMARELFIGELDPKKIKAAIYQTKFWPKSARDKIYTKTTSHSSVTGTSSTEGSSTMSGTGSGEVFSSGDWFSGPIHVGSSEFASFGSGQSSARGEMHADTYSSSEGEADVPIFIPVPFQELSSVQYYSIQEQLVELTAALKEQYGRHCFIKIHNQQTQPLLIPFVQRFYTSQQNQEWYERKQLAKQEALSLTQVDRLIDRQEHALLNAVSVSTEEELPELVPKRSTAVKESPKIKPGRSARASLFSKIKIEDVVRNK
jgi:hypothetical protein